MLKRIFSISIFALLVGLLLVQMQGTWVVFKLQQVAVRHEVKQQIRAGVPESDLVTLRIAKVWEKTPNARFEREHSKEFRFDGEMYDIIRSREEGDTTVYICIHDVKESGLFADLERLIEEEIDQPINKKSRESMQQLIAAKYVQKSFTLSFVLSASAVVRSPMNEPMISEDLQIDSPPPKILS